MITDSVGRRRLLKTGSELMEGEESNSDGMLGGHDGLLQSNEAKVVDTQQLSQENSLFMIVGFEVIPFSVEHTKDETVDMAMYTEVLEQKVRFQEIKANEEIVYTYSVQWNISSVGWASRWDAYLSTPGGKVGAMNVSSLFNSILSFILIIVQLFLLLSI